MLTEVINVLKKKRFSLSKEKPLQSEIEDALRKAGISFKREYWLSDSDKIDFLIGDIGIEIKIKGNKKSIYKQIERYAESDEVSIIVLVTNKAIGLPAEINKKSVYVVNLSKAWL